MWKLTQTTLTTEILIPLKVSKQKSKEIQITMYQNKKEVKLIIIIRS